MQVAVTGVSGFIGSYIAKALHADGHRVVGLVRESSPRQHIEGVVDRFVVGDHADPAAWNDLLAGSDAVVHNSLDRTSPQADLDRYLQQNLVASIKLLAASAPRPFVFVSSVAAVADILPQARGLITPEHPTRPASDYGAYKAAVEPFCLAAHLGQGRRISIVRPSAVYGVNERDLARSPGYDIIRMLRDTGRCDQPGGGKFVHVEDVAAVIAACLVQERANGQIYNLADCYARWGDWATMAAEALELPDAEVDLTSPPQPKNTFAKDNVQALGVSLDRGHDGIRHHLRELVGRIDAR